MHRAGIRPGIAQGSNASDDALEIREAWRADVWLEPERVEEERGKAVANNLRVRRVGQDVLRGVREARRRIDIADVVFHVAEILRNHALAVIVTVDNVREELAHREVMAGRCGVQRLRVVRRVVHHALVRVLEVLRHRQRPAPALAEGNGPAW